MPPPTAPLAAAAAPSIVGAAPPGSAAARDLAALKAQRRRPGEASFFYFESRFQAAAVKVLPGEFFAHDTDVLITTTLGSCIAVCLWDRERRVGGMNHFLLPDADGGTTRQGESGRYGSFAMELLVNALMQRGASRGALEAKVFGGGAVVAGMSSLAVGERNTAFVLDYLATERIPVVSKDVLDRCARKVCFLPASGKAMLKRLAPTHDGLAEADRSAARRAAPVAAQGGTVDLF